MAMTAAHVLLTNDDGVDAEGLLAVRAALAADRGDAALGGCLCCRCWYDEAAGRK